MTSILFNHRGQVVETDDFPNTFEFPAEDIAEPTIDTDEDGNIYRMATIFVDDLQDIE